MTLLRIFIYCFGGIALTGLWVASSFTSTASNAQRDVSVAEMILVPTMGCLLLIILDRWIHALWFGSRNVVRLKEYRPCPVCPFTGHKAEVGRNLVFAAHTIGPVHVTLVHRLPILISQEAAASHPKQDIRKIPGLMIARYTKRKVTLYIKNRDYQMHFASANQTALE